MEQENYFLRMKKLKNKLILINPPLSLSNGYGMRKNVGNQLPNLGLCYLASVARKIVSLIFNFIARKVFRTQMRDVGWTKMIKRDILSKINLTKKGAIVELELVAKAVSIGYAIYEVEVPYLQRIYSKSKCFSFTMILV